MPSRLVSASLLSLILSLALAACSGPSPVGTTGGPPASGPPGYATFAGTVAVPVDGKSGTFWVRAAFSTTVSGGVVTYAPTGTVDGLLTTIDGGKIPLLGTVARVAGVLTVHGGAYEFTATVTDHGSVLSGSGSYTSAATVRSSEVSVVSGSVAIGVSATPITASLAAASYCGRYSGFYSVPPPAFNEIESGSICFTTQGGRVSGSMPTSGEIGPGSPSVLFFSGTFANSGFSITLNGPGGKFLTITGQLAGAWSGSYSGSDGQGTSRGTWSAPGPSIPQDQNPPVVIPCDCLGG